MDVLAAAAEAEAELADDAAEPVHADDRERERGDLPSDDEEGPPEPDEDEDALPPGDVDGAGEAVEDDAAAAMDEAGTEHADSCPPLPALVGLLKNKELQEQLRWRGLSTGGNKPELLARLEKAITDGVAVLDALPDRAGRAAAAVATESSRWEALDSSKVDRPVRNGPRVIKFEI